MAVNTIQNSKGNKTRMSLSVLLFLFVVAIVAIHIRKYPTEGLKVKVNGNDKYVNKTQLADDTTLLLKNEESVLKVFKTVENFDNISGLKLNKENRRSMDRTR